MPATPCILTKILDIMKRICIGAAVIAAIALCGCRSHYEVREISRSRILIDSRYDTPHSEAMVFLAPYARKVDSLMSPVVGTAVRDLDVHRPESSLSNLLGDILIWGSARFGERPDFAVYNMGGIRAALAKGDVTIGDILDVAPFENKLCLLTLTGEKVTELFTQIAMVGGEGVSHGVALVISKDGKLVSATLDGKPIDPTASYRIATLDYLAQGNDKMEAFKAKTNLISPQTEENNVRYIIMDYFRAKGTVDARTEGRIVVK